MVDQLYNWTRFWIPRGESVRLDGGFLSEPQSKIGRLLNPNPVTLESVEPDISCPVLLGEPGIGKSNEIEKQRDRSKARVDEQGDAVLPFDLGVYTTDYNLCHDIFEGPTLEACLHGTHKLYLFLDSLDEGLIAATSLTRLLSQKLNDLPRDRLRFRIACRTAEWQSGFEGELRRLFGDDSVKVFELLPLCRTDAESAAEQNGIDPARFMAEVARNDVDPFASKPVTLNFLLKLFKRNNEFPSTQTELYLEGCKALCDDTEKRKDSRRIGKLDLEQRLILAARIAAITVFGNRSGIWIGRDPRDAEDEDVTLRDLCGDTESRAGETFPANEASLREVLEFTGLFSSGGQDRLRWRHQTYAEFLAALYLARRKFTLSQKLDLILHHGDPERKLVPQLHETAAWLAGMDTVVLQEIVKSEPDVLLRSDVARADAKDRERLVAALLKLYHEEERQPAWYFLDTLKKLSNPSLADQLRPYIANSSKWIAARQLAIHIAHACERKDLQAVLADLALDESAPLSLRCDAAHAVGEIGDPDTKQRLKPLIDDNPIDSDKQLKGYTSQALWPICLTTEELFDSITSGTPGFGGSYERFILDLPERLRRTDVLPALEWLKNRPHRNSSSGGINKLKDAIILLAWNNLDLAGSVDLFARVVLSRLMSHEPIVEGRSTWDDFTEKPPAPAFGELVSENRPKRRAVLSIMITLLSEYISSEEKRGHFWSFSFNNPFLVGDDLEWIIELFESAAYEDERQILAQFILWVVRWDDVNHVDALYDAVQRSALVANRFRRWFAPIALDSVEATELRARHKRDREIYEDHHMIERPLLKPSPAERIAELLDHFEDGKYEAWWQLNYFMQFLPDGSSETGDYHPDLRSLPGWQSADERTRARIVRASTKYLLHGDPDTDRWVKTDEVHRPALGGYKALYLLSFENPESIQTLPSAVWRKWAFGGYRIPNHRSEGEL